MCAPSISHLFAFCKLQECLNVYLNWDCAFLPYGSSFQSNDVLRSW